MLKKKTPKNKNWQSDLKKEQVVKEEKWIQYFGLSALGCPRDTQRQEKGQGWRESRLLRREQSWFLRMGWVGTDVLQLVKTTDSLLLLLEVLGWGLFCCCHLVAGSPPPFFLTSSPGHSDLQPGQFIGSSINSGLGCGFVASKGDYKMWKIPLLSLQKRVVSKAKQVWERYFKEIVMKTLETVEPFLLQSWV